MGNRGQSPSFVSLTRSGNMCLENSSTGRPKVLSKNFTFEPSNILNCIAVSLFHPYLYEVSYHILAGFKLSNSTSLLPSMMASKSLWVQFIPEVLHIKYLDSM